MTASTWKQVQISLWKWWLVRKRQPFLFLAELLWPCLLLVALIAVHNTLRRGAHENCYYDARALPSAGMLPYVQTMLCTFSNKCHNKSWHEDIPTFHESKFEELVENSQPIFDNKEVLEGIEALPKGVELISAAVKVLNNTWIQNILNNDLQMTEIFQNSDKIESFLISNGLEETTAENFLNATFNLANLFLDSDSLILKPIACDPQKLSLYLQSDDLEAIESLSNALCSLEPNQISDLVNLIQTNVDIKGLLARGENVANRTFAYDTKTLVRDITDMINATMNMPALQGLTDDPPPILDIENWAEDFGLFLDSALNSDDIDFQILDTWADLTLGLYLPPSEYESLQKTVSELTTQLHDFVDIFIESQSRKRKKRENDYQNVFSDLADEFERLARFILETNSLEKCVSGFLDNGLCSDSCFAFLEGECGEVEIEKALNQYLGTSPELQCIVSTMTSINDWKLLAIKKTILVEILQEFSSIGIQAISNFEETQILISEITSSEEKCMELLDNNQKSPENGTQWFCMLINDPISVLPSELADFQSCAAAKNVTLDELEKVSVVFWDLQETVMDSKDDILKLANVTFWTALEKVQENSNDLDDINNLLSKFLPEDLQNFYFLSYNVTLDIQAMVATKFLQTLRNLEEVFETSSTNVIIPWEAVLPDHFETAKFTTLTLKNVPVFITSWAKSLDEGKWLKIIEGFANLTESGCPLDLDSFWSLSDTVDLDQLETLICDSDSIRQEWMDYDLLNSISQILSEASQTGNYNRNTSVDHASALITEIIDTWIDLSYISNMKDSVIFDGVDEKLISSVSNFLESLENFFERRWSIEQMEGQSTELYSEESRLDLILECWKPYHQESQTDCKAQGDFAKLGRVMVGLLQDIETEYGYISELFDNTQIMQQISTQISSVQNFSQAFNGSLESILEEAGFHPEMIEILLNGYININRLIFDNFNITEEMLDDKKEVLKLFKNDDKNNIIEFGKALRKVNRPMIAKALNQAIDKDNIIEQEFDWRMEEILSLNWMETFFKLLDVFVEDATDVTEAASEILKVVTNVTKVDDQYMQILDVLQLFANGDFEKMLDGMVDMFETAEFMIGNDPAAENVQYLMKSMQSLELFEILEMMKFETQLVELFKDWQPVTDFLLDLNFTNEDIQTISQANLKIPQILSNNDINTDFISTLPEVLCDPNQLSRYVNFTEIQNVSDTLCQVTKDPLALMDAAVIFFEELDLETFIHLALTLDDIGIESNITRPEAEKTINSIINGKNALETLQPNLDTLSNLTSNWVINGSLSPDIIPEMGITLCGFNESFNINLHLDWSNYSTKMVTGDVTNDPCLELESEMKMTLAGRFIWNMIAPMLKGKLLYTPINELTTKIIEKANESTEQLIDFLQKAESFMSVGQIGLDITNNEETIGDLQDLLSSPLIKEIIDGSKFDLDFLADLDLNDLWTDLQDYETTFEMLKWGSKAFGCYKTDRFFGFESEADLEKEAKRLNDNQEFFAGLVFLNPNDSSSNHIQYKIRMAKDAVPNSKNLKDRFWVPGPDGDTLEDLKYLRGFQQIQDLIDRSIMRITQESLDSDLDLDQIGVYTQQFPYPCFLRDNFLSSLYTTQILAIAVIFGYALAMGSAIRQQIWEKESENAMVMEVMGMQTSIRWTIWLLMTFLTLLIISGLLTVTLTASGLLRYSNPLLVFLLFVCASLSILAYAFLMATAISKAVVGSVISILLYIMTFTPFMAIFTLAPTIAIWARLLVNLLMTSCFSFALNYVTTYEQQAIGIQWDNVRKSPYENDPLNFSYCCLMLLFDAFAYYTIGTLILLISNRNKSNKSNKRWASQVSPLNSQESNSKETEGQTAVGVSLKNLTKVFPISHKEERVAVNEITIDFHVGNVTALLGHNGAGKSTMIKMLTGIVEPTSGHAEILGFDTWTQWAEVQKLIGLCSQQSILYDTLTPEDHLNLYGKLKGALKPQELKKDVERFLTALEMSNLRGQQVKTLSEGMRRRLCVALAFIGGSQVVILDEPTSGVDPIARRHIWKLISEFKEGRTIIFTTHHLDEAELLSDKLAIIHQGSLLAFGSVAELKSQFGTSGFELTVNPKVEFPDFDVAVHVKNSVPNSKLLPKRHKRDLSQRFQLPLFKPIENEENKEFNDLEVLFGILDNEQERLGIQNYMLECTTLEQIFLDMERDAVGVQTRPLLDKVGIKSKVTSEGSINDIDTRSQASRDSEDTIASAESTKLIREELLTGFSLFCCQLVGLLKKRWLHNVRDWRYFLSTFLLPTILLVVSMWLSLMRPVIEIPPILLNPSMHGPNSYSFMQSGIDESTTNMILKTMLDKPGIGTSCMSDLQDISDHVYCTESQENNFTLQYNGPGTMDKMCQCGEMWHWTCSSQNTSEVFKPSIWPMNTTDVLFDLENQNINEWLLQTHSDFIDTRFGGWSVPHNNTSKKNLIVWYNNKAYHTLPAYTNAIHNAMLRAIGGDTFGISTFSHPLQLSIGQIDTDTLMQKLSDYGVSLMVLLAVGFLPSSFISYLIGERKREEKQVQIVSGVSKLTYWFSTFIWDVLIMLCFLTICLVVILGFDISSFTARQNLPAALLLIFAFWLASASMVYCLEKLFDEPSMGQLVILCGNVLIGLVTLIVTLILQALWWIGAAGSAYQSVHKAFLVFPPYALGGGLLSLTENQVTSELLSEYGGDNYQHPLKWDIVGLNITVLLIQCLCFHALNILIEFGWFNWFSFIGASKTKEDKDSDVTEERQRIPNNTDILQMQNLTKTFWRLSKSVTAVDNITVGIKSGECFGWLGLNGAGKSTTFKLLTGQLRATSGSFWMNTELRMGYCPQMDALDAFLTVEETLDVYARLRGIPSSFRAKTILKAMVDLDLQGHAHNKTSDLSGGTKRKLCAAIALLGSPHLILMDEPTSGMDAVTKRLVWRRIQRQITYGDSAIVLTSHSMEECEFLCTRLAIMADGRFQCLGTPDHIKNKYGDGYSVSLFFTHGSDVSRGLDFVHSRFPYCTNLQCHNATIQFRVANEPPSVIFGHVLANKVDLGIQDFAVKHTTLDEVFVNFASNTINPNVMEMRRPPSGESSSMSIHLETDGSYNSDEEQISHV